MPWCFKYSVLIDNVRRYRAEWKHLRVIYHFCVKKYLISDLHVYWVCVDLENFNNVLVMLVLRLKLVKMLLSSSEYQCLLAIYVALCRF